MIQRVQAVGIPFVAVTFDSGYGQDAWMRDQCQSAGLEYYADVKGDMRVYSPDPSPAFVPINRVIFLNSPRFSLNGSIPLKKSWRMRKRSGKP